jgi:Fe-S oxidoreductase
MATYKAEFLSHYYERHRRPITAYAFGLIHVWAELAAKAPWLANLVTQTPGLREIAKLAAGMAMERNIPAFAPFTFREWFTKHTLEAGSGSRGTVMLWPDTFNDHFHPETAIAAVEVLEHAGLRVMIPQQPFCCGRPLYDYGLLDTAKAWLVDILTALAPAIDAGVPIVVLEPSCAAVFRDEIREILPASERAKRLSKQTFTLGEFLADRVDPRALPRLHRRAIVHGHCHQKAIMTMDADERVLKAIELDYELVDSGCCGMAGSFGFENGHYDVSRKVGELVLLPAVRRAAVETLVIADGFSCREQIAQETDRRALHLAEVLALALRDGDAPRRSPFPERRWVRDHGAAARRHGTLLALAGAAAASWTVYRLRYPRVREDHGGLQ